MVLMFIVFSEPYAPNNSSYGREGKRVASALDVDGLELDSTAKYHALRKLILAVFRWARDIGLIPASGGSGRERPLEDM